MLTETAAARLVTLAGYIGGAPSRSRLERAAKIVEDDPELGGLLRAAGRGGPAGHKAFGEASSVLRAAGAEAFALDLLDLVTHIASHQAAGTDEGEN